MPGRYPLRDVKRESKLIWLPDNNTRYIVRLINSFFAAHCVAVSIRVCPFVLVCVSVCIHEFAYVRKFARVCARGSIIFMHILFLHVYMITVLAFIRILLWEYV